MKIVLNLENSFNNYHWQDKKELEDYIKYMMLVLWGFYEEIKDSQVISDNTINRYYDILDMFNSFEIKEGGK